MRPHPASRGDRQRIRLCLDDVVMTALKRLLHVVVIGLALVVAATGQWVAAAVLVGLVVLNLALNRWGSKRPTPGRGERAHIARTTSETPEGGLRRHGILTGLAFGGAAVVVFALGLTILLDVRDGDTVDGVLWCLAGLPAVFCIVQAARFVRQVPRDDC